MNFDEIWNLIWEDIFDSQESYPFNLTEDEAFEKDLYPCLGPNNAIFWITTQQVDALYNLKTLYFENFVSEGTKQSFNIIPNKINISSQFA